MTLRSDNVYLRDILESIYFIFQHLGDLIEFEFSKNMLVRDAVIRRFEIIGEASSKITQQFKDRNKDIEWQLIKDMRNKLAHEYFGITATTIY